MTQLATAALLTVMASCVSSETSFERPTRVFDFASLPLLTAQPARTLPSGASTKHQLRHVIERVRPRIAACLGGTSDGVAIDLAVTLDVEPASGATVESVALAFESLRADVDPAELDALVDATRSDCVHDALLELDASPITPPETAEQWTIHASLYTGSR